MTQITIYEILIGRTPFEENEEENFQDGDEYLIYYERSRRGDWLGEYQMPDGMSRRYPLFPLLPLLLSLSLSLSLRSASFLSSFSGLFLPYLSVPPYVHETHPSSRTGFQDDDRHARDIVLITQTSSTSFERWYALTPHSESRPCKRTTTRPSNQPLKG